MCDSIWSHYHHLERPLRMRRVTWPITGGQRWSTFLKSLTLIFLFTLSLFWELRRRLSHVMRKIAFFHCVGYEVYCACAVSRDLCIGGPPKPHVPIFWPQIVYSLYNFYGATMSIKGTFILEHPYVKAVFEMAVFRKFKGLNIKYSHWDPQKALTYPERRVISTTPHRMVVYERTKS